MLFIVALKGSQIEAFEKKLMPAEFVVPLRHVVRINLPAIQK